MVNKLFSLGAFLDVTTRDETELKKRIAFLKSLNNLEHVEIWWELEDVSEKFIKIIETELKGYQIIIHAPFINLSLAGHRDVNNATVAVLQKVYDIGVRLKAKVFTVHAGAKSFFQSEDETSALLVESLEKLRTVDSLICTLENMPDSQKATSATIVYSLLELDKVLSRLPKFGITLDIGHVIQNKEQEWQEWFKTHKQRIQDIHLHGAEFGGKAHFSLGKGDLDCSQLIQLLYSEGYSNFVTQEVVGREEIFNSWQFLQTVL